MEAILKQARSNASSLSTQQPVVPQQTAAAPLTSSVSSKANGSAATNGTDNGNGEDDFDAFAFLNDQDGAGAQAAAPPSKKAGFGGFLKKMAANTGAQLERSMQNLAVKMDQGKNPDLMRAAM